MNIQKVFHIVHFQKWRFLQLAGFLFLMMFMSPYVENKLLLRILTGFIFLNSIFVVFSTGRENEYHNKTVLTLWGCTILASVFSYFYSSTGAGLIFELIGTLAMVLMILILSIDILRYIFKNADLSFDSIFASLSIYLMIALMFAVIYDFVLRVNPGSFHFADNSPYAGAGNRDSMFYFSMVTIATLGYGDIVPITNIARMLSVTEAVVGQFFVAVVVALLIGKLVVSLNNNKK